MTDYNKLWTKKAESILLDRKIVKVHWLTEDQAEQEFGWYKRPIVITLDDGTEIVPQMDDEGNDGGALWLGNKDGEEVLPVLGLEDK